MFLTVKPKTLNFSHGTADLTVKKLEYESHCCLNKLTKIFTHFLKIHLPLFGLQLMAIGNLIIVIKSK